MDIAFTAETHMDKKKITTLSQVIYDTWGTRLKVSIMLTGLALAVPGLIIGINSAAGLVLILIGCIILSQINYPSSRNARTVLGVLGNNFPTLSFSFAESSFTQLVNNKDSSDFSYSSIIKLIETSDMLYLFPDRNSAFMLEKAGIQQGSEALKTFLSDRTGLSWERSRSLLLLDGRTLLKSIKRGN